MHCSWSLFGQGIDGGKLLIWAFPDLVYSRLVWPELAEQQGHQEPGMLPGSMANALTAIRIFATITTHATAGALAVIGIATARGFCSIFFTAWTCFAHGISPDVIR